MKYTHEVVKLETNPSVITLELTGKPNLIDFLFRGRMVPYTFTQTFRKELGIWHLYPEGDVLDPISSWAGITTDILDKMIQRKEWGVN
jgi:hypothetical protein